MCQIIAVLYLNQVSILYDNLFSLTHKKFKQISTYIFFTVFKLVQLLLFLATFGIRLQHKCINVHRYYFRLSPMPYCLAHPSWVGVLVYVAQWKCIRYSKNVCIGLVILFKLCTYYPRCNSGVIAPATRTILIPGMFV